ncbi:hypothetical protein KP509_03G026300 [Ceratopteris richardii]|nr:hypothetical protein KP509_03G026300 [Ceratopteris richardii]
MLAGGPDYYQPFRPPPTVTLENVSTEDQIQIVRERRGRWFEYAIHVAALLNAGFTPSMLDEITGISGVEQNKIVVASQVRSSLEESGMNVEALSYFNVGGGADLLYELRILTAEQRLSAALYALDHRMDSKGYRDLARSMKDFGRRKNDDGWESFTSSPGDSLAYSYFRLSKEVKDEDLRETILKRGIEYAETEKAQARMRAFLESGEDDSDDQSQISVFEILRMSMSEAGTSSTPYMLPVVEPNVSDFDAVPSVSKKGPFGIQHAEHGWKTWVSLPAWDPLKTAVAPVAVSCPNAALLPWKQKRKELNEPVIILADKDVKDIFEAAYYVVDDGEGRFALQNGAVVSEAGSRVLGKVFLALRPPAPEVDEIASIEWD